MESENQRKVKLASFRVAFLMEHQQIVPELKEIISQLYPLGTDPSQIKRDSPEYLLGAHEALTNLISALEGKC